MKKLFIIGLLLISILALGVSAGDISLSSLADVTSKPSRGFTTTFKVTNNNDTTDLTGLGVVLTTAELTNFNISFTPSSFGLIAGAEQIVTITGNVPDNINTRLSPFSGTITVSNAQVSKTLALNVIGASQLTLDNVKFLVDGKSKSIDDGDTRSDVPPGAKLEIKGDIQNIFTDDEDLEIQDVEIEITIRNIDDEGDDDLEETDEVGDISADDEETFSITFEIPEDVEADDYDVKIVVTGEDENGAKHYVEWNNVKIKVEKDKHDITVKKASVSPSKISCSRKIGVNVGLKNQGEKDEDEVVVRIESSDLGISHEDTSIPEIDEGTGDDTEYEKTYEFTVNDDVKAGTYTIAVKSYYETDTSSDSKSIDLIVESCSEEEPEEEDVVVVTSPPEEEDEEEAGPAIITTPYTETTEAGISANIYMILLVAGIAIAVIVILVMFVVLLKMRKTV